MEAQQAVPLAANHVTPSGANKHWLGSYVQLVRLLRLAFRNSWGVDLSDEELANALFIKLAPYDSEQADDALQALAEYLVSAWLAQQAKPPSEIAAITDVSTG